jgi:hypothetical protein
MCQLMWTDVHIIESGEFSGCITITFLRTKQVGNAAVVSDGGKRSYATEKVTRMIANRDAVSYIMAYIDLVPLADRTGRFYKKLMWRENENKLVATSRVVGENTLTKACSAAAEWLQLADPEWYTSHGLRALGATTMAENGASEIEICIAGFFILLYTVYR